MRCRACQAQDRKPARTTVEIGQVSEVCLPIYMDTEREMIKKDRQRDSFTLERQQLTDGPQRVESSLSARRLRLRGV